MIPFIGLDTLLMFAVGGLLIYLAIAKEFEPLLLLPIGFGGLLANVLGLLRVRSFEHALNL